VITKAAPVGCHIERQSLLKKDDGTFLNTGSAFDNCNF